MRSDQSRAVVKWGRTPSDLDSYAMWGHSRVCWYGRRKSSNRITGKLEQDKGGGYGPETVYFTGLGRCRGGASYCDIKYYVNDYSRTGRMLQLAQTEVTLYSGSRVAGTWKIQDCPRSVTNRGNWWHVFTLDARTNRLKWNCKTGSLLQTNVTDADLSSQDVIIPFVEKSSLKVRRISQ